MKWELLCLVLMLGIGGCAWWAAMEREPVEIAEDVVLVEEAIVEEEAKPEPDAERLVVLEERKAVLLSQLAYHKTTQDVGGVAQVVIAILASLGIGIPVTWKVVGSGWLRALTHLVQVAEPLLNEKTQEAAEVKAIKLGVEDKIHAALKAAGLTTKA